MQIRLSILAILGVLLAGVAPATAQSVRFNTGLALTDLHSYEAEDGESLVRERGFTIGGGVSLPAASWVDLVLAGAFTEKGVRVEIGGGGDNSVSLQMDYFEFSPMLKTRGIVYVLAGPVVAYRTGCRVAVSAGGVALEADCGDGDLIDAELSKADVAVAGGIGVAWPFTDVGIFLEVTGALGLVEIADDATGGRNRALLFQAGIDIPLSVFR